MTKKILFILLVSFSLSACGGGGGSSVSSAVSDPIVGRGMPSQLGD